MTTRITLEPAFVLHRRPYRNSSFIIELFTEHYGRVAALARSARGFQSRYKGKLELFSSMLVSWSGSRELKILGNVEFSDMPCLLAGEALICGFYLNELLLRLLHREDPYPRLFHCYQQTLMQLVKIKRLSVALRFFEKKLLEELGYGLPLQRDADTGDPIEADRSYRYIPERGFSGRLLSGTVVFSGKTLLAFREEIFTDEATLREAKYLMQLVLGRLLGNKPLKSRELFA